MYTLGIKTETGAFNCFRCQQSGSWRDWKKLIYGELKQAEPQTPVNWKSASAVDTSLF
jgi:hypothetical protein